MPTMVSTAQTKKTLFTTFSSVGEIHNGLNDSEGNS